MNIILLGPAWPYRGGIAAFTERLAHQFLAEGHHVHIVTFTLQYPSFLFPGKTQYSDSPAPADLNITRLVSSINPFNWLRAARQIARLQPDQLVFMHWLPLMAPCFGTIARLVRHYVPNCRTVAVLHNVIPHEPKPWDVLFTRYFVRPIQHFVALSDSVFQSLQTITMGTAPCSLSPHPLYDHYGSLLPRAEASAAIQLDLDTFHLLFFGLIRDYKGLDLLCRAMDQLTDLPVQLVVAGEFYGGEDKYAQWRNAANIVWHTGFVPDDQVATYFSAADLIVQPYKTATQSGVTQIAYHFEKPMLVTNVGGLPEIVPHLECGYVVDVDPDAIAAAIRDFASRSGSVGANPFLPGLQAQKARYSWSNMTAAILS